MLLLREEMFVELSDEGKSKHHDLHCNYSDVSMKYCKFLADVSSQKNKWCIWTNLIDIVPRQKYVCDLLFKSTLLKIKNSHSTEKFFYQNFCVLFSTE